MSAQPYHRGDGQPPCMAYDEAFKRKARRIAATHGQREAAARLGVPISTLRSWLA